MKLADLVESQELNFDEYINKLPKEIVEKLKTIIQNPQWHPEGNAFIHTRQVFNEAKKRGKDFAIAAIFHDLGKIDTHFVDETGDPHHHGHEKESMKYLDKYLHLFPYDNKELIYNLVEHHMRASRYDEMRKAKRADFEKNPYFKHIMDFHQDDINHRKEE